MQESFGEGGLAASMWAMIEMLRSAEMACFSACGGVASATCHGADELKERVLGIVEG